MLLYGYWRSLAAFRVRIALNLKGIGYQETAVDLDAGAQRAAAFRALNPQMALPALVLDDGGVLTQSMAIMEYLDEAHPSPPLLPADPRGRARVRALALITVADSHPLVTPRVREHLSAAFGLDEAGRMAWLRHWFDAGLDAYEGLLAGHPATGLYSHGDSVTMADVCLVSHAAGYRTVKGGLDRHPTVARIVAHCLVDDRFARAQPLRQPGAPAS